MATNPYSYGSLGQRWTVGEPTSKSLLDVSRVKADANRWALEQLIVDPDDTANFVLTAPGLNIDSNTLYVDSVYNSVGFRLTNPNDYAFNGTPSWVASGGAGNASVILVSGTTSIGYFAFADGTTGTDRYSGNIQYNHSTNTMSFNTNGGVEAMTINSAQDLAVDGDTLYIDASADRVGINTASPSALIHAIQGGEPPAEGMLILEANSSSRQLRIQPPTNADNGFFDARGGNMTFLDDGTEIFRYNASTFSTSSGINVGIGTASPVQKLELSGGTSDVVMLFNSEDTSWHNIGIKKDGSQLRFIEYGNDGTTEGANLLVLEANGDYVGIGSTAPVRGLHLEGDSGTSAIRLETTGGEWEVAPFYSTFTDGNFAINRIAGSGNVLIPSGSVGIGTASPSASLTVAGPNTATNMGGNNALTIMDGNADDEFVTLKFSTSAGGNLAAIGAKATTTGAYPNSVGELHFAIQNGSARYTAMVIDEDRQIGIGTVSPGEKLTVVGGGSTTSTANFTGGAAANDNATLASDYGMFYQIDANNTVGGRIYNWRVGGKGYSDGTSLMTLNASGNLLVGRTSATLGADDGVVIGNSGYVYMERGAGSSGILFLNRLAAAGDGEVARFMTSETTRGSISISGSTTSFNTTSDYRLKENVIGITDGITRIKSLKPSRFNFIENADRTVDGFVAHEVSDIVPEAITGAKDAVDEEGNPEYQGIDQSKLVPLLTAALQEAITKIETLETKVAALEAA